MFALFRTESNAKSIKKCVKTASDRKCIEQHLTMLVLLLDLPLRNGNKYDRLNKFAEKKVRFSIGHWKMLD